MQVPSYHPASWANPDCFIAKKKRVCGRQSEGSVSGPKAMDSESQTEPILNSRQQANFNQTFLWAGKTTLVCKCCKLWDKSVVTDYKERPSKRNKNALSKFTFGTCRSTNITSHINCLWLVVPHDLSKFWVILMWNILLTSDVHIWQFSLKLRHNFYELTAFPALNVVKAGPLLFYFCGLHIHCIFAFGFERSTSM